MFLSHLLLLFKFCHLCKHDGPEIVLKECGTTVMVKSKCPSCNKEFDWHSQPYMPGSQIKAGNFLLSMSIPLSGGSPAKVLRLFNHMGLGCIDLKTYYVHQRVSSFSVSLKISVYISTQVIKSFIKKMHLILKKKLTF